MHHSSHHLKAAQTTLLLHGGRLKLQDKRNDRYFARLTEGLENGDTVLFVGFAKQDQVEHRKTYEREKGFILAQTQQDVRVVDATEEHFEQQLQKAKAIHISGGDTPELVRLIQKHPDFMELI